MRSRAAVQPNYSPTFFTNVAAARAAGTDLTNGTNIESLATQYRYNTLNQVIAQQSPDGGKSQFWYDRLGRLAVSQNAKQAGDPSYSYTLYDALGRITEVGQKPQTTAMTQTISQDTTALPNWLNNLSTGSAKVQITRTVYDVPYIGIGVGSYMTGVNLRNRVAYSMVIDADNTSSPPYRAATFYSYDPHGNVDTLLQDYGTSGVMYSANNRFKLMANNYDLISGKVNQVSYQPGQADAFYHQYSYDAENRITCVRTSTDSIEWQNDASYTYYRHGPLAREEIGDLQLQGIDYAYTVQGWLKSINPSWVTQTTPTGSTDQYDSDGVSTPAHFERDAYKLNLNYFDDGTYTDFTPIAPNPGYVQGNGLPSGAKRNLYNGNIGSMGIDIRALATSVARDAGPMLYNYGYDQLNRITRMDAWNANGSFRPIGTSALTDYAERYGYRPNGNILTLNRNGDSAHSAMDQLSYKYIYAKTGGGTGEYVPGSAPTTGVDHLTKQLSTIQDAVTGNSYGGDIKNQSASNYSYDAIGELTADAQSEISGVTWNVYGKLLSLSDSGNTITYTYDAAGNRISKLVHGITTWYVRDAQGNVMSVYTQGNSAVHGDSLTQTEAHLYGSSRLGLLNLSVNCASTLAQPTLRSFVRGTKLFELTNHLGNVLATISDKKIQHSTDITTVAYYTADVINANDYYSFGMQMPVRSFSVTSAANYRYGFNGKENNNEVKGTGNEIDYGARVYDPRTGRFFSIDPLFRKFPELSTYQYASNRPIDGIDLDGKEYISHMEQYKYNGSAWDYLKWIPNAVGDVYNAAVDLTWNSGVHTVKDVGSGDYVKNLKTQVNQLGSGISQIAHNTWKDAHAPIGKQLQKAGQTLADPSTWETGLSIYILAKIPLPGGSPQGNLLKPAVSATATELSAVETKIVDEANSILNSKQFELIEQAYKSGTETSVKIGNRIINYSPETTGSSITLHASPFHEGSGFQLGPKAFESATELKKTFIQELYRLNTQGTGTLGVDLTRGYTDDAFNAAEKLNQYVIKK